MTTLAGTGLAKFTPDDLLRLPDDGKVYELVGGRLVEKTVSMESSRVGANIVSLLTAATLPDRQATVFAADLGYLCFPHDPGHVRKPDLSVIRRERLAPLGPADHGHCPIPADLVVEVVSPNDIASEIDDKVVEYLNAGFKLVWVVHPRLRRVHLYRADGTGDIVAENEEITAEPAIPAFRCKVAEFFA